MQSQSAQVAWKQEAKFYEPKKARGSTVAVLQGSFSPNLADPERLSANILKRCTAGKLYGYSWTDVFHRKKRSLFFHAFSFFLSCCKPQAHRPVYRLEELEDNIVREFLHDVLKSASFATLTTNEFSTSLLDYAQISDFGGSRHIFKKTRAA